MSDQAIREQSGVHDLALQRHGVRFEISLACRLFGHWPSQNHYIEIWPEPALPLKRIKVPTEGKSCWFCGVGMS